MATFVWDPDRVCFYIPYIDHPIYWYGVFFACGFGLEYYFLKKILGRFIANEERCATCMAQLVTWLTVCSVIGGRLAYVFFYGWPYYQQHWVDIVKVWEGGLASHGALVGILCALWILSRRFCAVDQRLTWLALLDLVAIPVGLTAACIRVGNFFNQEITGTLTTLPWGVEFVHPLDGFGGVVHPVQLYEACFYALLAVGMLLLWRRYGRYVGTGLFVGLLLTLLCAFRFGIEFIKVPQGDVLDPSSFFRMGQLLSIPFFVLGLSLLIRCAVKRKDGYSTF